MSFRLTRHHQHVFFQKEVECIGHLAHFRVTFSSQALQHLHYRVAEFLQDYAKQVAEIFREAQLHIHWEIGKY